MDENLLIQVDISVDQSYEKCDLSYKVFKDIDFTEIGPISFYRSDFRGSKFSSVTFSDNNFDLADFIGCSFINVESKGSNWGNCEIKNSYFKKCQFYFNKYGEAAIHNTTFQKCVFENETFKFTMFDCDFYNCQFINCIFDQCTTERLSFNNCTFIKTEMSTMHAENFKFTDCTVRDTYLGSCFIGTYLFKNVDMNLFGFKYRGQIMSIGDNYFDDLIKQLNDQHRYFEYLNLVLLCNKFPDYGSIFCEIFRSILHEPNDNIRNYNIKSSIDMLAFYYNSHRLPLYSFLKILGYLQDIDSTNNIVPANSIMSFKEAFFKLNCIISNEIFDDSYALSVPDEAECKLSIHCNDNSFEDAKAKVKNLIEYANERLGNYYQDPLYEIVEEKQGSVIITIATSLLLSLIVTKVVKEVFGTFCDIKLRNAKTNKKVELITKSNSITSLEKITVSDESDATNQKQIMKLYNSIGKDYIIGLLLEFFL